MKNICLIIAECKDGKLRRVSLEALGVARQLAGEGGKICAVLPNNGEWVREAAALLASHGAESVYIFDDQGLTQPVPETALAAIRTSVEAVQPDFILFGHTSSGRDLAPRLAAMLQAGQISDVTSIEEIQGEEWEVAFTRPIYAGKAFEKRSFLPSASPKIITLRPNNFPVAAADSDGGSSETVVTLQYSSPPLRTTIRDIVRQTSGKIDLAEADIIVAGGRGVKSAEGFTPLLELADVLGAAVGASRGACDAGYCDYALQIGQTGKVVTPKLYIACGISGAIQHLAGMSQSRIIVAINKDPDAPIFGLADYGIVGDLFEVVPLLTKEFRDVLQ
ncbi:electron transfer flavoprotein subunit alpha/FixB family protein [Paenibacillus tarimensis]